MPQFLSMPAAGPSFFAHVFHPAFNVDSQDASDVIGKFDNHVRAVGKSVQGLRNIFNRVREARMGGYLHFFRRLVFKNMRIQRCPKASACFRTLSCPLSPQNHHHPRRPLARLRRKKMHLLSRVAC